MNEMTLFCLCCLVWPIFVMPLRKRLSRVQFVLLAVPSSIVLYVLFLIAFAMLALLYGDK